MLLPILDNIETKVKFPLIKLIYIFLIVTLAYIIMVFIVLIFAYKQDDCIFDKFICLVF